MRDLSSDKIGCIASGYLRPSDFPKVRFQKRTDSFRIDFCLLPRPAAMRVSKTSKALLSLSGIVSMTEEITSQRCLTCWYS